MKPWTWNWSRNHPGHWFLQFFFSSPISLGVFLTFLRCMTQRKKDLHRLNQGWGADSAHSLTLLPCPWSSFGTLWGTQGRLGRYIWVLAVCLNDPTLYIPFVKCGTLVFLLIQLSYFLLNLQVFEGRTLLCLNFKKFLYTALTVSWVFKAWLKSSC